MSREMFGLRCLFFDVSILEPFLSSGHDLERRCVKVGLFGRGSCVVLGACGDGDSDNDWLVEVVV